MKRKLSDTDLDILNHSSNKKVKIINSEKKVIDSVKMDKQTNKYEKQYEKNYHKLPVSAINVPAEPLTVYIQYGHYLTKCILNF